MVVGVAEMVGLLAQSCGQGWWREVGVATRLARVGQGDPMAASGHGHVLRVDVDEVKGCLVHSFGQSGRCGVVMAAG